MIICDIFHKIHILFDKREKTYQVVLAIIKFVSRKLFHNPLFQILRKIGTDMSCNALHCHLIHIMLHHDTYQLFKRSFHRIPSQLLTGFSGISPKVHHIRRAIEILRHLYQHTSRSLVYAFFFKPFAPDLQFDTCVVEGLLTKLPNRMLLTCGYHEIFRSLVLQNKPHTFHIVFSIAPIAQ